MAVHLSTHRNCVAADSYLDCLIFDRMIGIVHILQRDAVELSLVDVRDAIVFASLG